MDDQKENCILPEKIKNLLPDTDFHVTFFEEHQNDYDEVSFSVDLKLAVRSEAELSEWLQEFSRRSYITWRIKRTYPSAEIRQFVKVLFKKEYRCHHNTRPESSETNMKRKVASKHTNCQAYMMITIRNTTKGSKSKDSLLRDFPTIVRMKFIHNHKVMSTDALKFRDVSAESKASLVKSFKRKHRPKTAIELLKYDLMLKYGNDYPDKVADRALCPDLAYAQRLYFHFFKKPCGILLDYNIRSAITDLSEKYNEAMKSKCLAVKIIGNQPIIALCTPLMKRTHQRLKDAGEIVFMDASSNADRQNCSVFVLLTYSFAGGLPLGILITPNSENAVAEALSLYTSILPNRCFGGRGLVGPKVFMINDSSSEQTAIRKVFPESATFLSTFHILQTTWSWLENDKHKIDKDERPEYLMKVKNILLSNTEAEMMDLFDSTQTDKNLPMPFKRFVHSYMYRKEKWSLCNIDKRITKWGNAEIFLRELVVLKDKMLHRTRAFNMPQLVEFVIYTLNNHYSKRLVDIANGCSYYDLGSSIWDVDEITKEKIIKISSTDFDVKSDDDHTTYSVNTEIGICSCSTGRNGAMCKHQVAVAEHYDCTSLNFVPIRDQNMRLLLQQIATGKETEHIEQGGMDENITSHIIDEESEELDDFPENDDFQVEMAIATLTYFAERMIDRLNSEPDVLAPAIKKFRRNIENIKTAKQMCSALTTFGKNHMKQTHICGAFKKCQDVQKSGTGRRRRHSLRK